MHLRLPVVAGVVVVAAAFAGVRALQHPSRPTLEMSAPQPFVAPGAGRPDGANANANARTASERGRTLVGGTRARAPAPVPDRIVVYVAGDVVRAGLYTLRPRARAGDALHAAGGARDDADLVAVNLAAVLSDGDEVAVYPRGSGPTARAHRTSAAGHSTIPRRTRKGRHARRGSYASRSDKPAVPSVPVDLNRADAEQLASLPGIGPALAERIVVVRKTSGPFASLDDLLEVGGMTIAKVDALGPYVTLR